MKTMMKKVKDLTDPVAEHAETVVCLGVALRRRQLPQARRRLRVPRPRRPRRGRRRRRPWRARRGSPPRSGPPSPRRT